MALKCFKVISGLIDFDVEKLTPELMLTLESDLVAPAARPSRGKLLQQLCPASSTPDYSTTIYTHPHRSLTIMENREDMRPTTGRKWKRASEACTFCRRRKVRKTRVSRGLIARDLEIQVPNRHRLNAAQNDRHA